MTDEDEFGLDAYFEAGRAAGGVPSADLLGRIMADAEAQMGKAEMPKRRQGYFASLMEAIGGWPVLAGMATAGVVGVWIGFSQPAGLDLVAEQIWGGEEAGYLVDLFPTFADDFGEG